MITYRTEPKPAERKAWRSAVLPAIWILTALASLLPVTMVLDGAIPIFTLLFLIVPLVALLRSCDAGKLGIRAIPWSTFLKYMLLSLAASLALMAVFEPWSNTYRILLDKAISSSHPDITFGWLVRYEGISGWAGFVLYAGLVSLFAEELFFRGWLLQRLQNRMSQGKAILWQAFLFTLPQLLAAFLLQPMQGLLYAVVYSWLAIGLIGGWAAIRTQSIWPSWVSALLYNLIMSILVT